MASITDTTSLPIQASQLLTRLDTSVNFFKKLTFDQIFAYMPTLSDDAALLKNLQQRATSAGGINQSDLDLFCIDLAEASSKLGILDNNYRSAEDLRHIENKLLTTPTIDSSQSAELQSRIRSTLQKNDIFMSVAEKGAFLLQKLNGTQHPSSSAEIIRQQDLLFIVTEATDKFNAIVKNLTQDPMTDFTTLQKFYHDVHQKSQPLVGTEKAQIEAVLKKSLDLMAAILDAERDKKKTASENTEGLRIGTHSNEAQKKQTLVALHKVLQSAISEVQKDENAKPRLDALLNQAFLLLPGKCKEEVFNALNSWLLQNKKINRPLNIALQGQPFSQWYDSYECLKKAVDTIAETSSNEQAQSLPKHSEAAGNLKAILEAAIKPTPNETPLETLRKVQQGFSKLTREEQETLFNCVNDVRKEKNGTLLPASYKKMDFHHWGSFQYRLEAVNKMIQKASVQSLPPAATSHSSAEMQKQFASIFTAQQAAPPPVSIAAPLSQRGSLLTSALDDLQKCCNSLDSNPYYEALYDSLLPLILLQSRGTQMDPFIIIGDRPNFHLYSIHRSESPENLIDDANYGSKAMAGECFALNIDRNRAIKRTMVEVCLGGLGETIQKKVINDIPYFLGVLERVNLHEKDCLENQQNIAHALFGKFYSIHCQALSQGRTDLVDPNSPVFAGDFGRKAFESPQHGIDFNHLLQSIEDVRNLLKSAWKM